MKFSIKTKELKSAIAEVSSCVATRAILPILTNVLISVEKEHIMLTTSDLEKAHRKKLSVDSIYNTGSITVPCELLNKLLSKIKEDEITLETTQETDKLYVTVSSKKGKYNLSALDSEDFPNCPDIQFTTSVIVDKKLLLDNLLNVGVSMSKDTTKNILNSIQFKVDKSNIELGATDGYQLSVRTIPILLNDSGKFDMLIPRESINMIVSLLKKSNDTTIEFQLSPEKSHVGIRIGEDTFFSRLTEGAFPDYSRIIPTALNYEYHVNRLDVIESIDTVSILSQDKVKVITLETTNDRLNISLVDIINGNAQESLPLLGILREDDSHISSLNLNANFLITLLKTFQTDIIKIKTMANSELVPIIIYSEENYNENFCMLMPIRK